MNQFFDTHAHLDYPEFQPDFAEVLNRARDSGIVRMVTIGTDLESSRRAIALAEKHAEIFAVVGWHPSYAMAAPEDIRAEVKRLASHPKVVAIGETGLDYYRLPSAQPGAALDADLIYKRRQAELFQQQLEVAAELGLNVVVHQRHAFADTMAVMEKWRGKVRGVFHCFVDNVASMQAVVAMGSLVSFTGIATFKNAAEVRETIAATPLGHLMLETDCPYLAPMPYRGKRCEPAYVREISNLAATTIGCTLEALSAATCQTADEFFRFVR